MSRVSYDDWERLHPRSLMVNPISTARNVLFPAAIALIGIGSRQPKFLLWAAPVLILGALGLSVLGWYKTSFRVADGSLVVRRGVLSRKVLTAPVERIRSVDLEATLLHRILRLQTVKVGTGVDDTQIELDALSVGQAESLRALLLGLAHERGTEPAGAEGTDAETQPGAVDVLTQSAPPPQVLATLNPRWAGYAPFSLARLAVLAGAIGALSQFDLPLIETGEQVWDWMLQISLVLLVIGLLGGGLLLWTGTAVAGYLLRWWNLRLFREGGNLRLTRGLFTTASTTVEEARIRGVQLTEPLLLRLVGGAETKALVTGLDQGAYAVLPQAPRLVATQVARDVLAAGESRIAAVDAVTVGLVSHGPAARRRCHIRAQLGGTAWVAPVVLGLAWFDQVPWWAAGVAVAVVALLGVINASMAYRHLGHALTDDHLVVGHGAMTRHRSVLERAGVIGWVLSETVFQRRLGLVTLVATTAAGDEQVTLRDVPRPFAELLARAVTPAWSAGKPPTAL